MNSFSPSEFQQSDGERIRTTKTKLPIINHSSRLLFRSDDPFHSFSCADPVGRKKQLSGKTVIDPNNYFGKNHLPNRWGS